jgi:hypothetical protein
MATAGLRHPCLGPGSYQYIALNRACQAAGCCYISAVRAGSLEKLGSHIMHGGLLLLVAGGLLSVFGRSEAFFTLAAGDSARISPAYTVSLRSFTFEKYDDGSSRAWISSIEVMHDGRIEAPERQIRVNAPLRLSGISLYQAAYSARGTAALRDAKGALHTLAIGDGIDYGGREWYFLEVEPGEGGQRAVFREGAGTGTRTSAGIGGTIGPLTVESVTGEYLTVLKAVRDPGAVPALCACGIILAGLCVSFIQRRRNR